MQQDKKKIKKRICDAFQGLFTFTCFPNVCIIHTIKPEFQAYDFKIKTNRYITCKNNQKIVM